jgi:hypothetical protein
MLPPTNTEWRESQAERLPLHSVPAQTTFDALDAARESLVDKHQPIAADHLADLPTIPDAHVPSLLPTKSAWLGAATP